MMNRKHKMLFMPFIFVGIFLLISYIVMLLWNAIPATIITGVSFITFPKAMGLLILSKILFGGFPSGRNKRHGCGNRMEHSFKHLTPEQKDRLRNEWKERFRKNDEAPSV